MCYPLLLQNEIAVFVITITKKVKGTIQTEGQHFIFKCPTT